MFDNEKTLWTVLGLGGLGLGLLGFCFSVHTNSELKNIQDAVVGASKRISDMSQIDVDQALIDSLVTDSVRKQTDAVVKSISSQVKSEAMDEIRNRVKQTVKSKAGDINAHVAERLAEEMAKVEGTKVIDDVVRKTTDKLVDKLGDDLDNEVGRIGKIYSGIVAALK